MSSALPGKVRCCRPDVLIQRTLKIQNVGKPERKRRLRISGSVVLGRASKRTGREVVN